MRIKGTDRKALETLADSVPVPDGYDALYPSAKRRLVEVFSLLSANLEASGIALTVETRETAEQATARLMERHDLTAAEAQFALVLAAGGTVAAYAKARGISRNTVRTHLQRIFQKMGVGRQADLVRLVLGAPPP